MSDKKKPGRPKKPAELKPEQFSIRLSPKMKFGLDLLSKAQGRSLSQAIEWAIQRGLYTFDLEGKGKGRATGYPTNLVKDPESLAELVELVWAMESRWQRLSTIYQFAPELLGFSDRSFCDAIFKSRDVVSIVARIGEAGPRNQEALHRRLKVALANFVDKYWDTLYSAVAQRDEQGRPTTGICLHSFFDPTNGAQPSIVEFEMDLEGLERFN